MSPPIDSHGAERREHDKSAAAPGASDPLLDALAVIGQMVAVLVVSTPAMGVAIRAVAFATDPAIGDPIRIAVDSPIPELAATTVSATVMSLFGLVLVIALLAPGQWGPLRQLPAPDEPSPMLAPDKPMPAKAPEPGPRALIPETGLHWMPRWLMVLVFAVLLAGYPWFPGGWITAIGTFVGGFILAVNVGHLRELSWRSAMPTILVVSLASAIGGGLSLRLPAVEVAFSATAGFSDGRYVEIGSADGFVVLRSCSTPVTVVRVASTQVISASVPAREPQGASSLISLLQGRSAPVWGIRYGCQ